MTRLEDKKKAIRLRHLGWSYGMIKDELGISKSTLSGWLSAMSVLPNQNAVERVLMARRSLIRSRILTKESSIERAKLEAVSEIPSITRRDLWMIGIGLYIGEGKKSNGTIGFTNSDPNTVKLIMRWFREILALTNDNFSLRVHIYPDIKESNAIKYWSKVTKYPKCKFSKTQIDTRKDKQKLKKNRLPYGTLHIVVKASGDPKKGIFLFRKIIFWINQINSLRD